MSDIALKVENLAKLYHIGVKKSSSFRDTLSNKLSGLIGKKDVNIAQEFWALQDVSFEVEQGEAVGIIGKNGAGKSTLLKILSRITQPTRGRVEINGRVASLLEVGTGFHAELSGRENIYLNGTILGMTRREIKTKFDEIVSFSGVEKFIDTPVKYYSSGMYVRLAFAVAAHLEPEILIIDEVLAVGDAEFQKKCLGKMEEVAGAGRTVLFVSHNMPAVRALCTKGILLSKGRVDFVGEINESLEKYFAKDDLSRSENYKPGIFDLKAHPNKTYDKDYGMIEVRTYCDDQLSDTMYPGCRFKFTVLVNDKNNFHSYILGFVIKDSFDKEVIGINNNHLGVRLKNDKSESFYISYEFTLPIYGNELYTVDLYLGDGVYDYDIIQEAFSFTIEASDVYKTSKLLDVKLNQIYVPTVHVALHASNSRIYI